MKERDRIEINLCVSKRVGWFEIEFGDVLTISPKKVLERMEWPCQMCRLGESLELEKRGEE